MADEMTWSEMSDHADRVIICGQGPSWKRVDLDELQRTRSSGVKVVAVNGAIEHVYGADYWFTLDFSKANQDRMRVRRPDVAYYSAIPEDYVDRGIEVFDGVSYLRRIVDEEPQDGRPFSERVWDQIVGGLAEDPGEIHTGNSGFGALNLVYHMRPSRVLLLGVDGHGRERWDGTKNRYLGHLPALFEGAVAQLSAHDIDVVNASPRSAVDCFPITAPSGGLAWIRLR